MTDKLIGGPFTKVEFVPFNLNSDKQVKDFLFTQGWQPTSWNYQKDRAGRKVKDARGQHIKTSPKLTEDSYDSIEGSVGQLIARRNILVHRRRAVFNITKRGELKGYLNLTRQSDGKIEARGIPQGTPTGRYRHSILVNVPKADPKIVYGKEMRELFTVRDGYLMLGTDASALEARMEGHYCYDFEGGHEYAHELVDGDIHSKNASFFGTDRDGAKSPKYCLTYGGQPPTLAETVGCTLESAQRMYDNFWAGNTALAGFREAVEREYRLNGTTVNIPQPGGWIKQTTKNGWIMGLDGRKIFIRSPHACVNAKFQSGGSIVVKMATIFMNKWVKEAKLDAHQIIHMHDEIQWEVAPKDVEALG
jgi:DNA polymerase I-like protein with 3'-5' exonuclease and polymerase domains